MHLNVLPAHCSAFNPVFISMTSRMQTLMPTGSRTALLMHYHVSIYTSHACHMHVTCDYICIHTVNHNRVHLKKIPGVEGSDYINASYVDVSPVLKNLI